jgi:hypothetical protein
MKNLSFVKITEAKESFSKESRFLGKCKNCTSFFEIHYLNTVQCQHIRFQDLTAVEIQNM